jgi:hypothetical protein
MPATTEELRALLDRVQKATGPDRELDKELLWVLGRYSWRGMNYWNDTGEMWPSRLSVFFTASIDAAVALVERVLPGWSHAHITQKTHTNIGYVHNNETAFTGLAARPNPKRQWFECRAPTPPLAILAAMLSALIALSTTEAPAQRGDA